MSRPLDSTPCPCGTTVCCNGGLGGIQAPVDARCNC